MLPEVILNLTTELNPKIDVWSLGCILYEILVGRRLFKGQNKSQLQVIKYFIN